MTLDYTKLTMALTPNASFNAPDTYDRSGLFLLNRAGTIVVYEARPGTPAAQAGSSRAIPSRRSTASRLPA